jgi:hypothetical protein
MNGEDETKRVGQNGNCTRFSCLRVCELVIIQKVYAGHLFLSLHLLWAIFVADLP